MIFFLSQNVIENQWFLYNILNKEPKQSFIHRIKVFFKSDGKNFKNNFNWIFETFVSFKEWYVFNERK